MIRIAIVKHFNLGNVKNLVSFFLKKFCLLNKNSTKNYSLLYIEIIFLIDNDCFINFNVFGDIFNHYLNSLQIFAKIMNNNKII